MSANVEIIGTIASVIVLIAFCLKSEKRIRIVDGIGALVFVVYGILKNAPSVVILNFVLVAIQAFKLYRIFKSEK